MILENQPNLDLRRLLESAERGYTSDMRLLTDLENPNDEQLLPWLQKEGYPYKSLRKDLVELALTNDEITPLGQDVLYLRWNHTQAQEQARRRLAENAAKTMQADLLCKTDLEADVIRSHGLGILWT